MKRISLEEPEQNLLLLLLKPSTGLRAIPQEMNMNMLHSELCRNGLFWESSTGLYCKWVYGVTLLDILFRDILQKPSKYVWHTYASQMVKREERRSQALPCSYTDAHITTVVNSEDRASYDRHVKSLQRECRSIRHNKQVQWSYM